VGLFSVIEIAPGGTLLGYQTHLAFDAWGGMFGGDEVIASAILDRLLHHSHVFLIAGPSFRMKGKLTQALEQTGG